MPFSYADEAVAFCLQLYLKFNGGQHERIEREMRKAGWANWSKQNLYSRGEKIGWVEKYGWEQALKLKIEASATQGLPAQQALAIEIEQVRKRLKAQLDAQGGLDRDLVYQYRDFCKLSIDAQTKLDGTGNTLEGFVACWELLMDWLPEISESAARGLLAVADQVLEKAAAEYGEKEGSAVSGSNY